ncbi:MAG: hypothetical protein AB202_02660 [Parcubacteria bacterium C7867-007]|nr:MAG: hypothetical protein AB202_02660 [Parcubacteria bacterium C7867-007]
MRSQSITTREKKSRLQTVLKKFSAILIGSFLTLGILLCFSFVSGISNHSIAEVPDHSCTSSEGSSPCDSISEHISYWQTISTAVFTDNFLLLLVSAALLFLWISHRTKFTHKGYALFHPTKPSINLGLILSRNPLQEAFASGTIHSKAF